VFFNELPDGLVENKITVTLYHQVLHIPFIA
jgi:hypothetical protein